MNRNETPTFESLAKNYGFISGQMRLVPKAFYKHLSYDEIKSELYITIGRCVEKFDPKRGNIFFFVKKSLSNALKRMIEDQRYYSETEVPLEHAYGLSYEPKNEAEQELLSYLGHFSDDILNELTDFVLGKKNKDELQKSPSFERVDVDRIINSLDLLVS